MPESWPASLPQVLLAEGFQHALGDGRVRYQADAGPAQVRRRSSASSSPMTGSMIMTSDQWDDLVEFGATTLLGWTLPFEFPDPAGGADLLVRFGESLPSRVSYAADDWKVSLALEVLP